MAGRSVAAGGAHVILGVKNNLDKGLKSAQKSLSNFGAKLTNVGAQMQRAGMGLGKPILNAAMDFADAGDAIHKMSIRTRVSAESLSTLAFAAEQSGTSINSVGAAMFRAQRRIANFAVTGGGPAAKALKGMGVNVQQLMAMNPEQQMKALADVMNSMGSEAFASQIGFEIFGDNIRDIMPLLKEGSEGINALQEEARSLGREMSGDDADAAAALTDSMNRLKSSFTGVTNQIGASVAGALSQFLDRVSQAVAWVSNFIKNNRDLVLTIAKIAAGVAAAGTIIAGLGGAFAAMSVVIGGIATAISVLLSPIGLVVTAIATLGAIAEYKFGLISDAVDWLKDRFKPLIRMVGNAMTIIMDAFAEGDLEKVWETVVLAMEGIWLDLTNNIQYYWDIAMNWLLETSMKVVKVIGQMFDALGKGIGKMVEGYRNYYNSVFNWVTEKIGEVGGVRTIGGPVDAASSGAVGSVLSSIESAGKTISDFGVTIQDVAEITRRENKRDVDQRFKDRKKRSSDIDKLLQDEADAIKERNEREEPELPKPEDFSMPSLQTGQGGRQFSAGTFSAAAAMFMGGSRSPMAQTAANTKRTADGIEEMIEKTENVELAAKFT